MVMLYDGINTHFKHQLKLIFSPLLLITFFCWKINEPFHFENASNLTYEFLYNNIDKKIFLNFILILLYTHVSNLMHFQDGMAHLFFFQRQVLRTKVLIALLTLNVYYTTLQQALGIPNSNYPTVLLLKVLNHKLFFDLFF